MKKKKIGNLRKGICVVLVIIAVLVCAFGIYVSMYYPADEYAIQYMEDTDIPIQEMNNYIVCGDADTAEAGYVFYPGAKVDAKAYMPYLIDVAKQGDVLCIVVKPMFRLAILEPNIADQAIAAYPQISSWSVGGHSLGGVVAASYAKDNTSIKGLLLLASYPNTDMTAVNTKVLSITASNDAVLNMDTYESSKEKLSKDTDYEVVAGGNHGQFGSYGQQDGDHKASISAQQQREEIVNLTVAFFETLRTE